MSHVTSLESHATHPDVAVGHVHSTKMLHFEQKKRLRLNGYGSGYVGGDGKKKLDLEVLQHAETAT
jgi:hypothetical protein